LPTGAYHDFQIPGLRKPYFTLVTSRGCRFNCAFCCSRGHFGKSYRLRSAADVVREIDTLVQEHGARYLGFHDDLFGDDDRWVGEFAELMRSRPYSVRWAAMAHPMSFRRDPQRKLHLLRQSGCDFLAFGLQSTHPAVMKAIHRAPREEAIIKQVIPIARALGIFTKVEYILGLPDEPPDVDDLYLEHALAVQPNTLKFFRLLLLEGAELTQKAESGAFVPAADADIDRRCAAAMRKFFLDRRTISNNLRFMAARYPTWPLRMLPHLGFLIEAIGLKAIFGKPKRVEYRTR
jgi:radical SAM superfamily enzyme YgiQ (UPF0313 family)